MTKRQYRHYLERAHLNAAAREADAKLAQPERPMTAAERAERSASLRRMFGIKG